jgi:uncharacterized paraquat-inducible protein A
MPRDVATDDEWEDNWEEDSDDDQEYIPEDEFDDQTVRCPHCQESIHEESERCPHCGQYVSEEDTPPSRKPWWIVLGAILCLFAAYLWVMS